LQARQPGRPAGSVEAPMDVIGVNRPAVVVEGRSQHVSTDEAGAHELADLLCLERPDAAGVPQHATEHTAVVFTNLVLETDRRPAPAPSAPPRLVLLKDRG
jgi:hypothetical protein